MLCGCCNKPLFWDSEYVVYHSGRYCIECATRRGYVPVKQPHVCPAMPTVQPRPTMVLPARFKELIPRLRFYDISHQEFEEVVGMLLTRVRR